MNHSDWQYLRGGLMDGLHGILRYGVEWGFKVCVAVAAVVAGGLVLIQACK